MKMTEPKYSKKTSFDRNKKYAYYESDIAKNDKKIEDYKNVRSMERERNLKMANGVDANCVIDAGNTGMPDRVEHDERVTAMPAMPMHAIPEPPFYYEKMNFIIHGMHSSAANHDAILRDFMPYGTPCRDQFDPATQQLEILKCEVEQLQKRLAELTEGKDAAARRTSA
jgi:hypothetical protein